MFGIPNLLRKAPKAIALTLLGNAVNFVVDFLFPAPTWGVYLAGSTTPAVAVSSVTELDIGGESKVSNYPLENGTFATYNKVIMPNMFSIRLTRDGSEDERGVFLNWLQVNAGTLDLFDILCPENAYSDATLVSYRVSRSSQSGAAMIIADCIFQEVRQIPALYGTGQIIDPKNQPSTPTARVNPEQAEATRGFPER
jgi:hypothetical protein